MADSAAPVTAAVEQVNGEPEKGQPPASAPADAVATEIAATAAVEPASKQEKKPEEPSSIAAPADQSAVGSVGNAQNDIALQPAESAAKPTPSADVAAVTNDLHQNPPDVSPTAQPQPAAPTSVAVEDTVKNVQPVNTVIPSEPVAEVQPAAPEVPQTPAQPADAPQQQPVEAPVDVVTPAPIQEPVAVALPADQPAVPAAESLNPPAQVVTASEVLEPVQGGDSPATGQQQVPVESKVEMGPAQSHAAPEQPKPVDAPVDQKAVLQHADIAQLPDVPAPSESAAAPVPKMEQTAKDSAVVPEQENIARHPAAEPTTPLNKEPAVTLEKGTPQQAIAPSVPNGIRQSLAAASAPTPAASQPQTSVVPMEPSQQQKAGPVKSSPYKQPTSTPWANDNSESGAVPKVKPVQMVELNDESQGDAERSNEEYRKQFSERKKFFKQQLEQQNSLPIKMAPPPAVVRQQAPLAADFQPPVAPTSVVLSPVLGPQQLRFPNNQPAQLNQVLPQMPLAVPQISSPAPIIAPKPSPAADHPQPQLPSFPAPQMQPVLSQQGSQNMMSPAVPVTPHATPDTAADTASKTPLWNPPSTTVEPPSAANNHEQPAFLSGPKFDARNMANSQPSLPGFAVGNEGQLPFMSQPGMGAAAAYGAGNQQPIQANAMSGLPPSGYDMNGIPKHAPLPDLTDLTDLPGVGPVGQKKTFMDSSFFADKKGLYPTFEEQVDLCRQISSSLTAQENQQSMGARMFTRRKNNSKKWAVSNGSTTAGPTDQWQSDDDGQASESETTKPQGPPPLKYYLSPRGVEDATSLMQKDPDAKICDVISPVTMAAVTEGLQNQRGRGADLFQKRKLKSEEWVIDETNVKKAQPPPMFESTPENRLQDLMHGPSVKYVKSPWEAALESPIGSCESAFQDLRRNQSSLHQNLLPPAQNSFLSPGQSLLSRTPSPMIGSMASPMPSSTISSSPTPLQTSYPPIAPKPILDPLLSGPRGWSGAAASTPKPFEPVAIQPPTLAPKPVSPATFKPLTPEPPMKPTFMSPEPMNQFTPQNYPSPTPQPVYQQFNPPQPQMQQNQPDFIKTVHRAAPPSVPSYGFSSGGHPQHYGDNDAPLYQPVPQTVSRRQTMTNNYAEAASYNQQPKQRPQSYYETSPRTPSASRHVTWHPEVKQQQNWTPQSTDEFKRLYEERHRQWERPLEQPTYRQQNRSRSQPPAPFSPNRGQMPSFGYTQPAPVQQQPNWQTQNYGAAPVQQRQSRSQAVSINRNSWAPGSYNQAQNNSGSKLGGWQPDPYDSHWAPKGLQSQMQSQPAARTPEPRSRSTGRWGGDMSRWKTQEIPGVKVNPGYRAGPPEPQNNYSQPSYEQAYQSQNYGSNQNRNQFTSPVQNQYGSYGTQAQQPSYGGSGKQFGGSMWNLQNTGMLVSDL